MEYIKITNQKDLEDLDQKICWDDTNLIEVYGTYLNQSFYPNDINYSGYNNINFHCLYDVCDSPNSHLEIIYIGCNHIDFFHIEQPSSLKGLINTLGNIRIYSNDESTVVECASIIYRFLDLSHKETIGYFIKNEIIDLEYKFK